MKNAHPIVKKEAVGGVRGRRKYIDMRRVIMCAATKNVHNKKVDVLLICVVHRRKNEREILVKNENGKKKFPREKAEGQKRKMYHIIYV